MSNIIDWIIIMTLIYLPMAAVIVGVVSFILFLILKYNNNRKYIIFLIISVICLFIIISVILFFIIGGLIGFGPID